MVNVSSLSLSTASVDTYELAMGGVAGYELHASNTKVEDLSAPASSLSPIWFLSSVVTDGHPGLHHLF